MGKLYSMLPGGILGGDENRNKYKCDECLTILIFKDDLYKYGGSKGHSNVDFICPFCEALSKQPTPKPSQEELKRLKNKVKE